MARPRLTEEEKKARIKEYNRQYWERKKNDPEFVKRHNATSLARYHRLAADPEYRSKEAERQLAIRNNWTEEQRRHHLARHAQYNRESRAMKKELGIPLLTPEQREKKNAQAREYRRERYRNNKEYRKYCKKMARAYYLRKKDPYINETEEEFYARARRMKEEVRKALNY